MGPWCLQSSMGSSGASRPAPRPLWHATQGRGLDRGRFAQRFHGGFQTWGFPKISKIKRFLMKIHEHPWKIHEHLWKSMENPWKSMEIHGNPVNYQWLIWAPILIFDSRTAPHAWMSIDQLSAGSPGGFDMLTSHSFFWCETWWMMEKHCGTDMNLLWSVWRVGICLDMMYTNVYDTDGTGIKFLNLFAAKCCSESM